MGLWLRLCLSDAHARQITEHGLSELPREACGVLLGVGDQVRRVVAIRNIAADPVHHYHMDERELARVIGGIDNLSLVGFYHTHPTGDPIPSPVDVAQANYPATPYLIVGLKDRQQPHFLAWRIDYTQVSRIALHIGDNPPPEDQSLPLSSAARIAILTSAVIAFILMIIGSLILLPPAPPIPR